MRWLHALTTSQWLQMFLTVVFMVVIVGSAVYVSFGISERQPSRNTVIILADIDCEAFQNQSQANALLAAISGDPFNLDADKDGRACEALP